MEKIELDESQKKFIDEYLQSYSIEGASIKAGYKKEEALNIGIELLSNPVIQEALREREEQFNKIAELSKLTPERLLNTMVYQYNRANKYGKTKEAVEILEKIAKWNGINPETVRTNPVIINISGVDEDKI